MRSKTSLHHATLINHESLIRTVKVLNIFAIALLIVGLLVGSGIGMMVFPKTVTQTETETTTKTLVSTEIQPTTIVKTIKETVRETEIRSTIITETVIRSKTVTLTKTITSTEFTTIMITRKVYPSESETVLVSDSGSGDKDTRPFTLNETSDLRIVVRIRATADVEYVGFAWYLYIPEIERWIKNGKIWGEQGEFEFYAASIPPGNYYVKVISANCKWTLRVEKVAVE